MAARDKHRGQARTNEYFVPRDGIDREVITADICRYLGNDALVRPGAYENPQTRAVQSGYYITAYRNLTTAMIADLKADSERWEAERRQTASRGNTSNAEYRSSTTHQSRQYYGPSQQDNGASYPSSAMSSQMGYDTSSGYAQPTYAQPAASYAPTYAHSDSSNYYVAGADYSVADQGRQAARSSGVAPTQGVAVPRTSVPQYSTTNPSYPAPQGGATYYATSSSQPVQAATTGYATAQNPNDPFYGRATVPGPYDTSQEVYDTRGYADTAAYSQQQQQQPNTSTTPTGTSNQQSGRREPERERDRDRHRRRP